ncbi:MAG: restriction endonuclease [Gammaproteobacteria bacterium]|nr:restriction endonuclease [Gammaproteobacteria bacterium]
MAKRSFLEDLTHLPWQVSAVLSISAYLILTLVIPNIVTPSPITQPLVQALHNYAIYIAAFLILPAPFAYLNSRKKRLRLETQKTLETIKQLSWQEFEQLIAEYYRRLGFSVSENTQAGPDGGVDIVLNKDNEVILVQCKQYRNKPVGVSVVREMFGIKEANRANKVVVVTTCHFTKEAIKFAADKDIELIGGNMLMPMIQSVQIDSKVVVENIITEGQSRAIKTCPKCGASLVLRTAKKGSNAGNQFWGCSTYPKCRFTKNIIEL